MGLDLSKCLVIGISSRALVDLEKENRIFEEEGLEEYCRHQLEHEDSTLSPGTGFPLVKAILGLNEQLLEGRMVDVIVMSKNSGDTCLRIFRSCEDHNLDVVRGAFTSGASLAPYLEAFDVDLFLSADEKDVQAAADAGVAAGLIETPPDEVAATVDQIRVAFDGDAVLFSDEAEKIYQEHGLTAFLEHETRNAQKPLPDGPFAKLLRTLANVQSNSKLPKTPIRIALVTARNSPAHERVIRTLRTWGVRIDETFFMGGVSKHNVLKAFGAHIFFDDQSIHCANARGVVPTAKVLPTSKTDAVRAGGPQPKSARREMGSSVRSQAKKRKKTG